MSTLVLVVLAVMNRQADLLIGANAAIAMMLVFGLEKLYLRTRSGDQLSGHEEH